MGKIERKIDINFTNGNYLITRHHQILFWAF